ncbi:STAS domain-containing protein [Streptomyces sp. NPDC090303]|uniref:STAS domain-containing protein n=1 Tax=Streptomyces sp. NPDC090303 TaxID=3365960 RepID=UPI003809D065
MKGDDCEVLFTQVPGGEVYSAPGGAREYRQTTGSDRTAPLQTTGEFDTDSVTCLRQALADAIADGATCVRVDLTSITFGDAALGDTLPHAQEGPVRLALADPPAAPRTPPSGAHRHHGPASRRSLKREGLTTRAGSPGVPLVRGLVAVPPMNRADPLDRERAFRYAGVNGFETPTDSGMDRLQ